MKKVYTRFLFLLIPVISHGQVTDIDGNTYQTVVIGNQEWMAENLRTSMLNDSTPISLIANATTWTTFNEPAMCWYNNDSAGHHAIYGRMYNGFAAMHPKICPDGWQMPSVTDWDLMISTLGGFAVAGGKMKHAGTQYWEPPNTGATNSSGFTAYPNGWRSNSDGQFNFIGQRAGWFALAPGNSTAFRWVSWSIESAGTGAISEHAGLCIRCFRTVSNVSIEEVQETQLRVWPNPSNGLLRLEIPNLMTRLVVRNILGQRVFQEEVAPTGSFELNNTGWPEGTYLLEIHQRNGEVAIEKWQLVR
jgi:uncharacterized protein (TIGR02145 family)